MGYENFIQMLLFIAQVEAPPKKTSPCAILLHFLRSLLLLYGLLDEFLPSNFILLLHANYTVEG